MLADKRLGQHFLRSYKVIDAIIAATGTVEGILEIGPGPGILTRPLSSLGEVLAIEKDPRMVEIAKSWAPPAVVEPGDALQHDWKALLMRLPEPRAVVSNMPYNITGPLLERVCGVRSMFDRAVLMMQREVGDRILALPGDSRRGGLSVVIQEAFSVKRVCLVPPGAFAPPPKVESIVLCFEPRPSEVADDPRFRRFMAASFANPRKKLLKGMQTSMSLEKATTAYEKLGLSTDVRAHQVSQSDWIELFRVSCQP